jgi:hypothetical protein
VIKTAEISYFLRKYNQIPVFIGIDAPEIIAIGKKKRWRFAERLLTLQSLLKFMFRYRMALAKCQWIKSVTFSGFVKIGV